MSSIYATDLYLPKDATKKTQCLSSSAASTRAYASVSSRTCSSGRDRLTADVVGDAGTLVDPRSVYSIAEGLRRICADARLREDLRARCAARAADFTWERAAQRTVAVYREALVLR